MIIILFERILIRCVQKYPCLSSLSMESLEVSSQVIPKRQVAEYSCIKSSDLGPSNQRMCHPKTSTRTNLFNLPK